MEINFANLISPLSVQEFFQEYWEKKLLHLERNQADFYDHIFNVNVLDDYLQREDISPLGFRLAIKGEYLENRKWTKDIKLLDGSIKNVVNPEKAFENFYEGATIIINAAQSGIPYLAESCRILEQEFKFCLQSNIYITPPNSQGFAWHYDLHDILSLQIKGNKTWRIFESEEQLSTRLRPIPQKPELIREIKMQEGNFLYLPRGTIHEAYTSESPSIHLNFSFKPRYGYHLLQEIADIAEREYVFFRKTIPNGFASDEEKKKYIAKFAEQTYELFEKHKSEELLERQYEKFVENQQFNLQGRFNDLLQLENLTVDSVVSRRTGMELSIKNNENGDVKIKFGRNEIIIPRFIDSEIFFQTDTFTAKDIKGLITEKNKLELIKEFLRRGFLRIERIQ